MGMRRSLRDKTVFAAAMSRCPNCNAAWLEVLTKRKPRLLVICTKCGWWGGLDVERRKAFEVT